MGGSADDRQRARGSRADGRRTRPGICALLDCRGAGPERRSGRGATLHCRSIGSRERRRARIGSDGIGHRIAVGQATAGDHRGAHATARRIAETSGIDGLLAEISEVQCWENEVVEAVVTARTIACADARCSRTLRASGCGTATRTGPRSRPHWLWRARKQSRTVQDAHPRLPKSLRYSSMPLRAAFGREQ